MTEIIGMTTGYDEAAKAKRQREEYSDPAKRIKALELENARLEEENTGLMNLRKVVVPTCAGRCECGTVVEGFGGYGEWSFNYCPKCGAKLDWKEAK